MKIDEFQKRFRTIEEVDQEFFPILVENSRRDNGQDSILDTPIPSRITRRESPGPIVSPVKPTRQQ